MNIKNKILIATVCLNMIFFPVKTNAHDTLHSYNLKNIFKYIITAFADRTYYPLSESIEYLNRNEQQIYPLIPFEQNGYYGYADNEGNTIIKPQYKIALPFSEGLAAVADENYKFGYIDTQGKLVIPHKYFQAKEFSDGLAVVSDFDFIFEKDESEDYINFVLFNELADNYFYIDKTGNDVFSKKFRQAGNFSDGYAPVAITDNTSNEYNPSDYFAYINKQGEICKEYNSPVQEFQSGFAIAENHIIDTNFNFVFDGKEYESFSQKNGYITAKKDGKYGVINLKNETIIDFNYEYLSNYNDGLFAFKTSEGCGYIDINENIVIAPEYSYTDDFIDGRAIVIPKNNENIMYFINNKNEKISKDIPMCYYTRKKDGLTMIYPDNTGIYINTYGEPITGN